MTAAALATACGGSTDGDGSSTGGAGGTGQGGTAGTSGSGTGGTGTGGTAGVGGGGTGGTSGTSGSSGSAGSGGGYNCPTELPGTWDTCDLPAGAVCKWDVKCQSGVVAIEMECDPASGFAGWKMVPKACTKPYDSCPNTDLYCSDTWTKPMGTNPPAPCPATPPKAGEQCYSGGFGGVWPNCGYACSTGSSDWTIATCDPNYDGGSSVWQLDGACDP